MSINELESKCRELRQLQSLIDEAQAETDSIRDAIKAAMGASESMTAGEYKITWKNVTSARIDTSALKKALPDVAEVPEIQDGVVEIRSIAREAGSRTKIAVYAEDPNVDPVGACVGPRGVRVQAVVDEIFGEKIDVIEWSDTPEELISNVLAPAKVEEVMIDPEEKSATVVVPDYQLSLAIGKEGQNVRLAAKLSGWKIDIKSHSQYFGNGEKTESAIESEEEETFDE